MSSSTKAASLVYPEAGEPLKVLQVKETDLPVPDGDQVSIEMIAAPINPSDVLTVQGIYPMQPPHRVPGHEGVGRVIATGPSVTKLRVGQLVIPLDAAQGTWTTRGNFSESSWHAVPDDLPIADAATLAVNPGTALGMLRSFVDLRPGDVVVQTGANSSVGEYVIAMARSLGVRTVNIVRDRPDWDSTVKALKTLGADVVATPETVADVFKQSGLPAPRLALDCVGGDIAGTLVELLAQGGTLVSYGVMASMQLPVSAPALIFKDVRVRGYWIAGGLLQEGGKQRHAELMDELAGMVKQGVIKAECTEISFDKWQDAIGQAAAPQRRTAKVLLRMN